MSHDYGFFVNFQHDLFSFFYLEYKMCLQEARGIIPLDKSLFCPNFYYVFYAEVEIHLNRFFTENSREQWSLLFVDYNFMPPIYLNENNFNRYESFQIFKYQPHILTIVHNAKIKYCCLDCECEWTTARGRAIFQAEIPEINKYNILFAYLFTQKCQKCRRETAPSWYVDEATRVMKNVCRILLDQFYSHRQLELSSSSEDDIQRLSDMKDHHQQDLCQACQEGSCYASNWRHQQMR